MPEYLAPGVYVEETSFRSKSLEGVSTSTAGFVGPARYGPVSGEPELLTSFADFERIYGGLEDLVFTTGRQPNYLAHAVRAFYEEGGRRLYVSRIFDDGESSAAPDANYGHVDTAAAYSPALPSVTLHARFPGAAGNMRVTLTLQVGSNALTTGTTGRTLTRVGSYDLVHVGQPVEEDSPPTGRIIGYTPLQADGLMLAVWNSVAQRWELQDGTTATALDALAGTEHVRPLSVVVEVEQPEVNGAGFQQPEQLGEFGFDLRGRAALETTFARDPDIRLDFLTVPFALETPRIADEDDDDAQTAETLDIARELLGAAAVDSLLEVPVTSADRQRVLAARRQMLVLSGGSDGELPSAHSYEGNESDFHDYVNDPLQEPKNGLLALESVEDISIVAAPGYSAVYLSEDDQDRVLATHGAVISHCERMKYRIAVLDSPPNQLVSGALGFRNLRSSKYGAIYYPWVVVANPQASGRLKLPPSGFVAGIYARNDIERAVYKAPANEVVRLAIDFEQRLNKAQQEALNPNGVNCFRFFEGRGYLLWGARTISDDPEWKYVNLRRYFAYLERTIDVGTQWVVFEPNGPQLWDNVRRTVEDFLYNEWRQGALLGSKPEEAYFVRCDRSTMTPNDLDNGRLVCLIGVSPVRPAEFVIFRIGQWTATATA